MGRALSYRGKAVHGYLCSPRVPSYANANGAFLSKSQATPGQHRLLVFCDVKYEKNEYHVITTPNVT